MRAKTIFEKFKEDSDPICDLGIGSFKHNINFTSKKKLFNYIIKIIPNILKTKKIPDDILLGNSYINNYYYYLIHNYINKYITYGNKSVLDTQDNYKWPYHIRQILLKMGYKSSVYFKEDKIKNNIYEIRKH